MISQLVSAEMFNSNEQYSHVVSAESPDSLVSQSAARRLVAHVFRTPDVCRLDSLILHTATTTDIGPQWRSNRGSDGSMNRDHRAPGVPRVVGPQKNFRQDS